MLLTAGANGKPCRAQRDAPDLLWAGSQAPALIVIHKLIVPTLRVGMPVLGAPAPRNLPPERSSTGVPTPERGNHHNVISVDARRFQVPDG